MAPLRAVVIGCGRMGAGDQGRLQDSIPNGWLPISHLQALLNVPDVTVVGLCDVDEQRLRERGKHYGISTLETDYRRLLDEVRPDIVTIATRTPGRSNLIQHACKSGAKGLYIEKPIANTIGECAEALDAARAANATVFYGVNRRYHAAYRRAQEVIADGVVGEVREIIVENGRSQLLWTHPHSVDSLLQFAAPGRPSQVSALLDEQTVSLIAGGEIDSDPIVEHAVFQFDTGVIGTISKTSGWNLRVAGSKGNLTIHADGTRIEVDRLAGAYFLDRMVIPHSSGRGATVTAMSELVQHVRAGGLATVPAYIESGIRMLIGCVWSHMNGSGPVSLEAVPENLRVTGRYGELLA